MDDIKSFFHETQEAFTIYVVEQRFVVGRGYEYFKSFIGKDNLIADDSALKRRISKIVSWTQSHIPNISELVKLCFLNCGAFSSTSIVDIITALSNLFSVEKHQAVGPEIIDPLIIQEGKITPKYLAQLVSLHQESILQPTIIILLVDNNFDRAKNLISKCPHGINVKFIRNSGECVIYKIINNGADDSNEFIDLFSKQCFSTCSSTRRDILIPESSNTGVVNKFAPHIFRYRSLLVEENNSLQTLQEINNTINAVIEYRPNSENEEKIKAGLICMLKLIKVYCLDRCTVDMQDAYRISQELDNDILRAHVLRYSNFFNDVSFNNKIQMLEEASQIFERHNIEDHAIYCTNNYLINQFYTDHIDLKAFHCMQEKAVYNVPGLVGMSYIFNNTGVAFMYNHHYDEAIELFYKGLAYAKYRPMQKFGLLNNILIAKHCNMDNIDNNEIHRFIGNVFDLYGCDNSPFLTANFVANAVSIAAQKDYSLAKDLINCFPVVKLFQNALSCGQFGTGSLSMHLSLLQNKYNSLLPLEFKFPNKSTPISGIRMRFLKDRMLHPTIFNAWL